MQIDLQQPLVADSMLQDGRRLVFRRDSNAFFVTLPSAQRAGTRRTVTVYYHGQPTVAKHAPWDGGFVWTTDSLGAPWVATAVQGFGASAWWPTKDTQSDEPDSQRVAITVPSEIMDVSNGRLRSTRVNGDGTTTYEWAVRNPVNNYGIAVNAAKYAHFADTLKGERGPLTLDFYPLAIHADTARVQFAQAKPMLSCFEHWFGPFPWYEDGYKLVETPHLGMEHQSAVAYGNHYKNGYLGKDRSATGIGMTWDFIIVHESGHEWFGNNITTKDIADMWVHESFTTYAENLFTECQQGKAAGARYVIGQRQNIKNDVPIIGEYGVNAEGSSDMYDKGSSMLHTMRQIINDDEKWRGILRGLGSTFGRQTVTGRQIQQYINTKSGIDFDRVFAQYLTTTKIPVLEYRVTGDTLSYRWSNVVPGFDMPVRASIAGGSAVLLRPTESWRTTPVRVAAGVEPIKVDENFYVTPRDVGATGAGVGRR
jgi:aminopeptidase N